jgi:hypothetical protein
MSEQTFDQQIVTRYLLGALPEAEAERLDELSVSDDDFAAVLSAAEKDLIDAYVQGELAGAELAQFKSHYLASSLRREKVKFAQVFQAFAEQNAGAQAAEMQAVNSAASAPERRDSSGWFSGLSWFFASRIALRWGLAVAALALLVTGSWLVLKNIRLRQQMSQTQVSLDQALRREQELQKEIEAQRSVNSKAEEELARVRQERERLEQELKQAGVKPATGEGSIVSLILAPPLRGASQVPAISIKPGTSRVAAQLQLEAADYSAYRVALIDPASNQTLWRSGGLKPSRKGERKSLAISFRADLLKPQNYILKVTGTSGRGSETVGDYPFRVVR